MKADYQRDAKANYLVLESEQEICDYQIQMLEHNELRGILPIKQYNIDNKIEYYYDITSKQTLEVMLERKLLTFEQIKGFLIQWKELLEEMEEFLLNPDFLLLDVNYIYVNLQNKETYFCYYPREAGNFREQIKEVFRYFLDKVNYQDRAGVNMVYQAYQMSIQEEISFTEICCLAYKNTEGIEKEQEEEDIQEEIEEEKEKQEEKSNKKKVKTIIEPQIIPEFLQQEREEKVDFPIKKEYLVIFSVAAGSLILLLVLFLFYQNGITKQTFLQCGAILLVAGSAFGIFLLKGKEYMQKTKIVKETEEIPYSIEEEEEISFIKKNIQEGTEEQEIQGGEEIETVLLGYIKEESLYKLASMEGQEDIIITGFPFTIGKLKEQVDKIILDDRISRIHARLEEKEGKVYIIDLNSKNGIYVNGVKSKIQEKVEIQKGDEVKIATFRYCFIKEE